MKLITKTGEAKFKVSTPGIPGSDLDLDFNPIINEKKLKGNYTIIHWQGRPKGHREWGIYQSKDDSYSTFIGGSINAGVTELFMLDDKTAKTLPSAVLISPEDKVTCINEKTIIGEVFLSDLQT
ncbi:MAG: hypothetical protein AAFR63_11735 [Cyanobacteria bacterium J06631_6]